MISGVFKYAPTSAGTTIEEGEVNYESLHTAAVLSGSLQDVKGASSNSSSALQVSTAGIKSTGTIKAVTSIFSATMEATTSVTSGSFIQGGNTGAGALPASASDSPAQGATGAVSITHTTSILTTDIDADAWTLDDGASISQIKRIVLGTDGGGNMVVTPANYADGTNITFQDAGHEISLMFDGTNWRTIANSGCTIA
tara:strand:- start:1257 stop:1850 length:594 start_codon:yes stop_codon:yes gene_type:complete